MRILDATAGARSIWYQKDYRNAVYLDQRIGKFRRLGEHNRCKFSNDRVYKIYPTIVARWEHLPFRDNCFDMVVFDPPHLFKHVGKKIPNMSAAYGLFYHESWREILTKGLTELFRVLKPDAFFILKWCDIDKPVEEIIKLFPYVPVLGTRTGQSNNTHWICFIKHRLNKNLEEYF